jgi:hypothetical protein
MPLLLAQQSPATIRRVHMLLPWFVMIGQNFILYPDILGDLNFGAMGVSLGTNQIGVRSLSSLPRPPYLAAILVLQIMADSLRGCGVRLFAGVRTQGQLYALAHPASILLSCAGCLLAHVRWLPVVVVRRHRLHPALCRRLQHAVEPLCGEPVSVPSFQRILITGCLPRSACFDCLLMILWSGCVHEQPCRSVRQRSAPLDRPDHELPVRLFACAASAQPAQINLAWVCVTIPQDLRADGLRKHWLRRIRLVSRISRGLQILERQPHASRG